MANNTNRIDEKMKNEIDSMTYEEMLRKWRFAPVGDPLFIGEAGEYFIEIMDKKKPGNHSDISKNIGWDK